MKALLQIMVHGHSEGRGLEDTQLRSMFTLEHVLASNWYTERLAAKQANDIQLWKRHTAYLEAFFDKPNYADEADRLGIKSRLRGARAMLQKVRSSECAASLRGTLGVQPLVRSLT